MERVGECPVAFDYRSRSVVAYVVEAMRGRPMAGAMASGSESTNACLDIVGAGEGNRFVTVMTPPASFDRVPTTKGRLRHLAPVLARMAGNAALAVKARRKGVRTKFVWGSALLNTQVGPMTYQDFLPAALADGRYVAAPGQLVAGHGLEAIPAALDRQLNGVSACKVVVTL